MTVYEQLWQEIQELGEEAARDRLRYEGEVQALRVRVAEQASQLEVARAQIQELNQRVIMQPLAMTEVATLRKRVRDIRMELQVWRELPPGVERPVIPPRPDPLPPPVVEPAPVVDPPVIEPPVGPPPDPPGPSA